MDASKYHIGYFPVDKKYNKWVEKDHIEQPPIWCSVDMRDGNQSLVIPMSLEEKLEYYKVLLEVGFKEIEVGFPAASETEYEFLRTLIDRHMIPEDVTVQVLTQCREHIIRKTFDACKGAPSAIIHFYNSVSVAQREQVFKMSKDEVKQIAVDGAKLVKRLAAEYDGNFRFEYSPESFTGTEPEYALEVCNAVLDVLEPSETNNVIINLPVTVEMSMPHVYASQVEYMNENLKYREFVTLSLHPHNDRGTGAGALVFAAFSGSHQDAIAKGMKYRNKKNLHTWSVPYIPIDPKDIGRTYDADVIRVNSQSGKGGIGYLLEQTYGYNLPPKMREQFSYLCKEISDREHKELKPDEVLAIFEQNYLNLESGIRVTDFDFERENDAVKIDITFMRDGVETELSAEGNGTLSAINNALTAYTGENYTLQVYTQHSMQGQGSHSVAASYIGLEDRNGRMYFGAGTDTDVITANTKALLGAFYNMTKEGK